MWPTLGDVLRIVADPLDHAGDLQRCDDFAQIVGHRRAQGDDLDGQSVDLALERVELAVVRHDPLGQLFVAADKRVERAFQRGLGEPAHLGDEAAKPRDVLIEGFDCVFGNHPYRPVI